jgi:hypothetical protein
MLLTLRAPITISCSNGFVAKLNNKKIELRRTSNEKSYKDFINCTQLPDTTQVCFIDDQHYSKMEHENVVYIHINPYIRNIPFTTMASKYYNNNPGLFKEQEIDKFINYIELTMLIRDADGNIHIINRSDCKNDMVYYEKIYNIKMDYTKKYKSIVVNLPKNIKEIESKNKDHISKI